MKTKFVLLCSLFLFSCFCARGQTGIDTISLLSAIAESEYSLIETLNEELSTQQELKIERFGRYSCPFSEAMENTFIRFALEHESSVELTLDYYDLSFRNVELEDEYNIQLTFQKYYPNKLNDFLRLKLNTSTPVTLNNVVDLINLDDEISFIDFEARFNDLRRGNVLPAIRNDVGASQSSTFINGKTLGSIRFPEHRNFVTCECDYLSCFARCIDIENDVVEGVLYGVCLAACGVGGPWNPGCDVCILAWLGVNALPCSISCSLDYCSEYYCDPGEPGPHPAYCDPVTGVRMVNVCNCEGSAFDAYEPAPCPEGTGCYGAGECLPCEPQTEIDDPVGNDDDVPHDDNGGDFAGNTNSRDVPNLCRRPISLFLTPQNETAPNANNGAIEVTHTGGYSNFEYSWSDGATTMNRVGLDAGVYCLTVTDSKCCYATACTTILEEACIGVSLNASLGYIAACDGNNGSAFVNSVTGGLPPYSYTWSNGAFSPSIDNLASGNYTVTISDNNGCSQVEMIKVFGNGGTAVEIEGIVIGVCGSNLGSISTYTNSGVNFLNYSWSNGDYTPDIENLSIGSYTLTATDECNTQHIATFVVGQMSATADIVHNVLPGNCAGSITLTIEQGTGPYFVEYSGPQGSGFGESNTGIHTFSDLCTGNYNITITDARGCSISQTENVCDCPDVVWGEWTYDPVFNNVCKTYTVPVSAVCEATSGAICFEPDIGDWQYDSVTELYCRNISCPSGEDCGDFNNIEECFTPIYGGWYVSSGADQYCRDVTCNGDYFCDGLVINECSDYTLGTCTPNSDDECECEVLVNDEFIGIYEYQEPEIEWDYDENANLCLKIIICNGVELDPTEHDPIDYGDWEFDIDAGFCIREVICADEQDDDYEQTVEDPEVDWTYDDWDEVCIALVYCDDDLWGDVEEEEEPLYTNWDFGGLANDPCEAVVNCGFNGNYEPVGDDHEEPYEISSWEIVAEPNEGYLCQINITCGEGVYSSDYSAIIHVSGSYTDDDGVDICIITCLEDGPGEDLHVPCSGFDTNDDGTVTFNMDSIEEIYEYDIQRRQRIESSITTTPNPFKQTIRIGNLPIDQGDLVIEIIDSKGEVVKRVTTHEVKRITINTSKWAEGIYFINVYNKDRTYAQSQRVIKVN